MVEWGNKVTADTPDIVNWHIPTDSSVAFASELVNSVGSAACSALATMADASTSADSTKEERCNALLRVRAVLRCPVDWARVDNDTKGASPSRLKVGRSPLIRRCLSAYVYPLSVAEIHAEIGFQLAAFANAACQPAGGTASLKTECTETVVIESPTESSAADKLSSEVATLRQLCKAMSLYVGGHGEKANRKLLQLVTYTKGMASDPLHKHRRNRPWVIRRVALQHHFRQFGTHPTICLTDRRRALLDHLLTLATNPYSAVRRVAQEGVTKALRFFPYMKPVIARQMTTLLQRGVDEVDDGAANGAIHVLLDPQLMVSLPSFSSRRCFR
eukprot:SAG31_NODE_3762_length_3905_cov_1.808460_2_plen_330_part_00